MQGYPYLLAQCLRKESKAISVTPAKGLAQKSAQEMFGPKWKKFLCILSIYVFIQSA